jgi:hypothetical protein
MSEENANLTAETEPSDNGVSGSEYSDSGTLDDGVSGYEHSGPGTFDSEAPSWVFPHNPFANAGPCGTCMHPAYGTQIQYNTQEEDDFNEHIRFMELSKLTATSATCGFCYILYEGIQCMREIWVLKWAKWRWQKLHPDDDIWKMEQEKPWEDDFRCLLTLNDNYRELEEIPYVCIHFGDRYEHRVYLRVYAMNRGDAEQLIEIEFYTNKGMSYHVCTYLIHSPSNGRSFIVIIVL